MSDSIASTAFFAMSRCLSVQDGARLCQLTTQLYHELLALRDSTLPPMDAIGGYIPRMSSERLPIVESVSRKPEERIQPAYAPYESFRCIPFSRCLSYLSLVQSRVPRAVQHTWVSEQPTAKRMRKIKACEHNNLPGYILLVDGYQVSFDRACMECAVTD